jgi:hypothetical protein
MEGAEVRGCSQPGRSLHRPPPRQATGPRLRPSAALGWLEFAVTVRRRCVSTDADTPVPRAPGWTHAHLQEVPTSSGCFSSRSGPSTSGRQSRPNGDLMTTAFVFSGGVGLGAVQVGTLHALGAHRIVPDFIVGTLSAPSTEPGSLAIRRRRALTSWRPSGVLSGSAPSSPSMHAPRCWASWDGVTTSCRPARWSGCCAGTSRTSASRRRRSRSMSWPPTR